MATIAETEAQLRNRQQQISEAQQQVQSFRPEVERTQRFLRTSPQGTNILTQQTRLKEVERLRGVAKEQAIAEIKQAQQQQAQLESQFQEYLQSEPGKVQYVLENPDMPAIRDITQTYKQQLPDGSYYEGEVVVAREYETPYGKVEVPVGEKEAREQFAVSTEPYKLQSYEQIERIRKDLPIMTLRGDIDVGSLQKLRTEVPKAELARDLTPFTGMSILDIDAPVEAKTIPALQIQPADISLLGRARTAIETIGTAAKVKAGTVFGQVPEVIESIPSLGRKALQVTIPAVLDPFMKILPSPIKEGVTPFTGNVILTDVETQELLGGARAIVPAGVPPINVAQPRSIEYELFERPRVTGVPELGMTLYRPIVTRQEALTAATVPILAVASLTPPGQAVVGFQSARAIFSPSTTPTQKLIAGGTLGLIGAGTLPSPKITITGIRLARPGVEPKIFAELQARERAGTTLREQYQLTGIGREPSIGRGIEVTYQTPIRELFGFDPKVIYRRTPTERIGQYAPTLKELSRGYGLTEKQARQALRFTSPRDIPTTFTGVADVLQIGEAKPIIAVRGRFITRPEDTILRPEVLGFRRYTPFGFDVRFSTTPLGTGRRGTEIFGSPTAEYEKLFFTQRGDPFQKLIQRGRTTERFEVITGVKPLGKQTIFTNVGLAKEFDVFQDLSVSRGIAPKRRIKRYSTSKVLFSTAPPKVDVTYPSIDISYTKITKPAPIRQIDTKQLMKDLESIYGKPAQITRQAEIAKLIPAFPKPRQSVLGRIPKEVRVFAPPKVSQSLFYGTGAYERTQEIQGQLFAPLITTRQGQFAYQTPATRTSPRTDTLMRTTTRLGITPLQLSIERVTPFQFLAPREGLRFRDLVSFRTETVQRQIPRQRTGPGPIQPLPTRVPTPRLLPPERKPKQRARPTRRRPEEFFAVELRRSRRFRPIARARTPQQAFEIGKAAARAGLGASIRVRGARGYLVARPGAEFGIGKRDPFTLVQRKTARLTSPGERREIVGARRTRTPKIKTPKFLSFGGKRR